MGDDDKEEDQFKTVMNPFYEIANEQFQKLQETEKQAFEAYDAAVRFYCEDPSKMQPDEFFSIFTKFLASWKVGYVFYPMI